MLKRFKIGGVHPPENKLTNATPIEVMPLPEKVIIPLSQHIGAPASAAVAKGDKVLAGQLIGQASGYVSANIHSSVSGTVTAVDDVADASGIRRPAVTIQVEGDEWLPEVDRTADLMPINELSKEEIIARVSAAGIVGMGGATFPTHVKLSVPAGSTAEYLIINGAECEPYLTADHRVMLERADEFLAGVAILAKVLGVKKTFIGIENNKKDAIELLKTKAIGSGIEVTPLKTQYPQGGEKQLIDAVLKRRVPSGKLPVDVGAVVQNVGTALAVYEAVQKNKPLVERVVTVTGKHLAQPKNLMVRIGTPVKELIEFCGGVPENTGKVILGGPMMGRATANLDSTVTKGTSGVLLMGEKESVRKEEITCIKCTKCVQVCPMALEPYLLYKLARRGMNEELEQNRVTDCIECGSCSYTCPSYLPLLDYIRIGKSEVIKIARARK